LLGFAWPYFSLGINVFDCGEDCVLFAKCGEKRYEFVGEQYINVFAGAMDQ
jgi:hypothetical protein